MTIRGHRDLLFLIHIRCDQGTRLGLFTYLVAVLVVLEACVVVHKTVQLLEALVFLLCLEEPLATLVTGDIISDMSLTKAESDCQYIGVFCCNNHRLNCYDQNSSPLHFCNDKGEAD